MTMIKMMMGKKNNRELFKKMMIIVTLYLKCKTESKEVKRSI